MNSLDYVIAQLEETLKKPVVLDYAPVNKANGQKLVKDKNFRANQRQQKAIQKKVMATDKTEEGKTLSDKIADKIAPP